MTVPKVTLRGVADMHVTKYEVLSSGVPLGTVSRIHRKWVAVTTDGVIGVEHRLRYIAVQDLMIMARRGEPS